MRLPEAFVNRMKDMLGDEFDEFMASYDMPRHYGLRVNTLKIPVEKFRAISPFSLEPVPWAEEGFYIGEKDRPAKHPYYHAGLYYIQEPSAMITVKVLDPQPGDKVLDLCAAPGGKSTQIAARLAGKGLLVANDVNYERIKGLIRNLEMFGIKNYAVLHEIPKRLAQYFQGFFDKIVIDAPCSGEGMFRKDPGAVKSWGDYSIEKCTGMQRSILKYASEMLKPGGYIVYSTCTFAPEENEGMMEEFIAGYPEFEVADIVEFPGKSQGRPEWAGARESLNRTARLWPHKIKGEGHFVALLRKTDGDCRELDTFIPPAPSQENLQGFNDFMEHYINNPIAEGNLIQFHSRLYSVPRELPDISKLKVIRPGWFLGEIKKHMFKPVAPMALGLSRNDAKNVLDLASDSDEVVRYLKGETINVTGNHGWNMVCVDGYPLGWAKQLKDRLNNYYPSGWRWLD